MYFTKKVERQFIKYLEEKELYREAIDMVVQSLRYNLKRAERFHGTDARLQEIYNAVSYLGEDNGLPNQTERRILKLVLHFEEEFIKRMHSIK